MTTFETIMAILNLIAVLLIPVIAVIVGQYLQERTQKRKDKMQIFQCLMTRRATGWAGIEAVNALNSIDIIFADSSSVRGQWKILLEKSRPDITAQDYYLEQCKLLELMANDLGIQRQDYLGKYSKAILSPGIRSADSDEYPNHEWTGRVGQSSGAFFAANGCTKRKTGRYKRIQYLSKFGHKGARIPCTKNVTRQSRKQAHIQELLQENNFFFMKCAQPQNSFLRD